MAKEMIITMAIVITLIAVVLMVTPYKRKHETTQAKSCIVVDCVEDGEVYEVTIRDHEGNLYAYYDDRYMPNGYLLRAIWKGNRIVNVRY